MTLFWCGGDAFASGRMRRVLPRRWMCCRLFVGVFARARCLRTDAGLCPLRCDLLWRTHMSLVVGSRSQRGSRVHLSLACAYSPSRVRSSIVSEMLAWASARCRNGAWSVVRLGWFVGASCMSGLRQAGVCLLRGLDLTSPSSILQFSFEGL